jgi:hypothetical protein
MASLFQIGDDLMAILSLIEDDGEVTDQLSTWFDEIQSGEAEKLDGYIGVIRTLESQEAVAKAEAEQFATKARARANKIKYLKETLKGHLERTGRSRVTTKAGRNIRIQANGGAPSLTVDVIPVEDLPAEFVRTVTEVNEDAIKAALKAGKEVPFARFEPKGTHLRIA